MTSVWIDTFLEAKAAEYGAAQNTLAAYKRDLDDFTLWLKNRKQDIVRIDRSDVEAYLIDCDGLGLARATRARRLSAIKQLFRFAYEEGLRDTNPTLHIKGPRREKKLPGTLSEAQVDAILNAARTMGKKKTDRLRNTCLLELLYATGMRVSELMSLPVAAARGDPRMLLIRGKGGKERLVPLSLPAREALSVWLEIRDRNEDLAKKRGRPSSLFLFPSSGKLGHMTRQTFYLLVKSLAVEAGISPELVTPHTLRHAFATHLLANGADLRVIQILLGHADIATTEIYTHVLDERLKSLVLEHHPLAHHEHAASGQSAASRDRKEQEHDEKN